MPWQCRFHETQPQELQIGDMWFAPEWLNRPARDYLSPEYFLNNAHRPPIVVMFPGGVAFCIDRKSSDGTGWTVTGEPPNITVSPSIDHRGKWHGFLQNGVISDDVEGRRYEGGRPGDRRTYPAGAGHAGA